MKIKSFDNNTDALCKECDHFRSNIILSVGDKEVCLCGECLKLLAIKLQHRYNLK